MTPPKPQEMPELKPDDCDRCDNKGVIEDDHNHMHGAWPYRYCDCEHGKAAITAPDPQRRTAASGAVDDPGSDAVGDDWREALEKLFSRYLVMLPHDAGQLSAFCILASEECKRGVYPESKMNRWLGYVQGRVIAMGLTTVERERHITRPIFKALENGTDIDAAFEEATVIANEQQATPEPVGERKFNLGDRVEKIKGSAWHGVVVGFYSTELTPVGYAVESEREPGSVQIYPEAALTKRGE